MKKARKILSLTLVMLLLLSSAAFSTSAVMNCEIELGESEYAFIEEETVYYQFTPVKDGWYTFFSESYSGHDPYADLYDSDGELIGINFDRNWEGVGGDIQFLPDYQRSIIVDIRYVLFIIDKYAGATHLREEMELN